MPQVNHDLVLVGETLLGTRSSKTFLTWPPVCTNIRRDLNSKSFRFLSCHCHFEESAPSLHNFYRIEVWRLARPLHDSWQYVLGLCHVGRWIHSPSSLFFKVTWPCPLAPQCSEVWLYYVFTSVFDCGNGVFGLYWAFVFLQTLRVKLMPERSRFWFLGIVFVGIRLLTQW